MYRLLCFSVLLVGCTTCGEATPGADAPLEVRETAPAAGAEETIEVALIDGVMAVGYESGLGAREIVLPVGAWMELHLEAGPEGGEPMPDQRVVLPELGWRVDVPPAPGVRRWVRARRAFDETAECAGGCMDGAPPRRVRAVPRDEWDVWVQSHRVVPPGLSVAQWGARLEGEQGCRACHGTLTEDLSEVWGQTRALPDGVEITVSGDAGRAWIEGWIREPQRYQGDDPDVVMPAFDLPQEQVDALIAYMRCGDVADCPDE